ncbi:MAG: DNRLRE domain-containing protein [Solirubrobacteraceae bacterium]|nr:DNRLRE domain-containing protein [Solirubrobacteraceae bacterium]
MVMLCTATSAAGQAANASRAVDPVSTSDLVSAGREVPADRSVTSRTFRVAKGAYVTRVYGAAVHERGSGGGMARVASDLTRRGDDFVFEADDVAVRLPAGLRDDAVRVSRGQSAVGYSLVGAAAGTPTVEGATAVYRDVFEQTDIRLTALAHGVKEDVQIAGPGAPARFAFDLTVSAGAKATLGKRGEITVDGRGDEDFEIAPPFMHDAARAFAPKSAARYELRKTAEGYRVTLTLDAQWLRDGKRRFPVTVDPTVTATGPTQTVDASLLESVPDSGYGASEGIFVGEYAAYPGYDNRGVLRFDLTDVPADAKVLQAKLGLRSYYKENSSEKEMGVHALTRSFTTDATWNDHDGTGAWTAAGGDFEAEPAAVATVGASLGWHAWHPTELVQEWVEGSRENHGLLVKDMPGEPENGTEFRSSEYGTATDRPYIDVMWHPRTGDLPVYTYDEHRLADGTVVKVNVRNGNVVYARPAAFGTGPGEDFVMGHYFNSMLQGTASTGGFGTSPWVAANGKWVGGTVMDNGDFIHQGLTGYVLPFLKQSDGSFKSPPELDATMTEDTGAGWNERYELEFRDGAVMTFSADGTWTSRTDRDENTYTLNYPSPSYQHTSVTGTDSEDTTFSYTTGSQSQDLLQTVTNPDDKELTYGYTSDRLTSETYESETLVTYGYDGNGRLASITDGESNTIGLAIDSLGRLEELSEGNDETEYAYIQPDDSCDDSALALTTISEPDGTFNGTCFDPKGFELPPLVAVEGEFAGDLTVTPTEDPETASFATTAGSHVAWVVARMPATKVIDQVTLGNFGKASGCSSATTASLTVGVLEGSGYGYYTQIALAAAAEIPGTAAPVTWDLSTQVTLEKDKAYRFLVHPQTGCNLERTTWAQPSVIDGGARQCAPGPERSTTTYFGSRIWHNQGTAETDCNVIDMPASLASGWYSTRTIGTGSQRSILAGQALVPPAPLSTFDEACDTRYSTAYNDGLDYGLRPELYMLPEDPNFGEHTHAACRWINYAPRGVKPANGWHYAPAWQPGATTRPRAMYAKLRSTGDDNLLDAYAPQLVHDFEEDFHADAWQTATDLPAAVLWDRTSRFMPIAAGPSGFGFNGSPPILSEEWLVPAGSPYPNPQTQYPETASSSDYLSLDAAPDDDLASAGETIRNGNSQYTDKTYARAVRGSNDQLYLQYWFWYLDNHASSSGITNHEGDWEYIQIRLNESLVPVVATYSQHTKSETCDWSDIETTVDGRPIAYPSRNRHANYFKTGQFNEVVPGLGVLSQDYADGDGTTADPTAVDVTTEPAFLRWPGRWGKTINSSGFPIEADSPKGPKYQATWDPVEAENRSADVPCTVE